MKRFSRVFFIIAIVVVLSLGYTACIDNGGNNDGSENDSGNVGEIKPITSGEVAEEEITKLYLTINSNKLEITLAKNSSVDALVERLKEGDITYTANDYGGFEKVGGLGFSLPSSDTTITTQAGDVILYSSNQIVLFYGSNTWSYTRLGRIEGYSPSQLKALFGNGSVEVRLSIK